MVSDAPVLRGVEAGVPTKPIVGVVGWEPSRLREAPPRSDLRSSVFICGEWFLPFLCFLCVLCGSKALGFANCQLPFANCFF
jgi:hypothetical protein